LEALNVNKLVNQSKKAVRTGTEIEQFPFDFRNRRRYNFDAKRWHMLQNLALNLWHQFLSPFSGVCGMGNQLLLARTIIITISKTVRDCHCWAPC